MAETKEKEINSNSTKRKAKSSEQYKSIMDRVIYWVIFSIVSIIRMLPLSICFVAGGIIGAIAWGILPMYRRLARENMTRAFKDEYSKAQIRQMVFRHFITLGANLLSALKMPVLNEKKINSCCGVENKELLLSYLQQGRGVVMAISHMGNWELFAQLNFLLPNIRTGAIYQSLKNKELNKLIDKDRQSRGVVTFDRKKGFTGAINMLREGGLIGVLVDQHAGGQGLWTPFFGRLASTSPLPALLAYRSGAVVIPVAIFTKGFARWKISIRPPISYEEKKLNEVTTAINASLEEQIRESPPDWFWLHNRWKIPDPRFLLAKEKRGVYLPEKFNQKLSPFSILVRSSNWLGDAVMSVPTVQALKRGRIDARITVLAPEKLAALWQAVPEVDEVLTVSSNLWNTSQKLRNRFDVAILFPNSLRSALEVFLARIPRRIGYAGHHRTWLLNQIIRRKQKSSTPIHHTEQYAYIAERLGASSPQFQPLVFERTTTPSSTAAILNLGLCPGAEYGPAKCWPAHSYREVLEKISREIKCQWKIFGTLKDRPIAEEIVSGLSPNIVAVDLTGKTSLAELISELTSLQLLLTNDTGTMHLAALLGVPVVAIFGSTEPLLTSPFGENNQILRHQVECSPCFLRTCPIDLKCMKAISPERVKEAILEVLK